MTLFTPSTPDRVVTLQRWSEGFSTRSDLRLFMHRLTHELCDKPEALVHDSFSYARDYLSARGGSLLLPNNWRLSIIAMVPSRPGMNMFHGDPLVPTYEVMTIPPDEARTSDERDDPDYDCSPEAIDSMIARLLQQPEYPMRWDPRLLETTAKTLPPHIYDAEVHGSFLFGDRDHYRDDLWANRVSFSRERWWALRAEARTAIDAGDPYAMLRPINRWCAEHCRAGYAWTMGGPLWVFESSADATLFKVVWS